MRGRALLLALLVTAWCACAPIQTYENISPELGPVLETLPGGSMVRIERSKDLPNLFGRADLWGGKVILGTTEVRYGGLTSRGEVIFRVSDLNYLSSETTMTRYGVGGTLPTLDRTREELPPSETEFTLDLSRQDYVPVGDLRVRILSATPASIRYRIERASP